MNFRLLRALAWLRWRLLVNGLKGARTRGFLEFLSRWSDTLVPILGALAFFPVVLILAVLGGFAGFMLTSQEPGSSPIPLVFAVSLLLPFGWFLIRPLMAAAGGTLERSELLRLLPIPTAILRNLELFNAALDPIFLFAATPVIALPVGVLASGQPAGALLAALAGMALLAFLLGLGGAISLSVQLLLRNRRRGEAVTLVFLLLLAFAGFIPQLIGPRQGRHAPSAGPAATPAETRPHPYPVEPPSGRLERGMTELPLALRAVPTFAYGAALEAATRRNWAGAGAHISWLALLTLAVLSASVPLHSRLLTSPDSPGGMQRDARVQVTFARYPGLSPGAAAVARAQLGLLTRTVRGKMALAGPLIAGALFSWLVRSGSWSFAGTHGPFAVAAFVAYFSLLYFSPFFCNQFATEGGGLTLTFLEPLDDRTLVAGKAAGLAIAVGAACAVGLLIPALFFPATSRALWLAAWLSIVSVFVLLAPLMALLSAVFPKAIDLGRIGRSSQPHGLASLVTMLSNLGALLPPAACIFAAFGPLDRPWLAPLFVLVWLSASLGLARALLPLAARVVTARRENLMLVATGH